MRGSVDELVRMANDIGNFFASEPDRESAVAGIATHVRRFWAPRMRRAIYVHLAAGGAGLAELPKAALERLELDDPAARA